VALAAALLAWPLVVVRDPAEPDTLCGPLRSPVARDRVLRYLALAQSEGGHVALGGRVLERDGWWFAPTVVGGLAQDSRLVREEVLGPVLMVVADDPSARA
jgi:aldehyde dehydrogenase (NAD+)